MFADWFVTEIVNANELRAFLRVRQGAIVDRFDGGMAVIAAYAIAKTMLLSLALAFALIAIAMVHQFVRRTQCARMRSQA
jgi:hypothetical protein